MSTPIRILMVEDNPLDAEMILQSLREAGFEPDWQRVDTEMEYLERLRPDLDVIFSDYVMPQFDGARALRLLKESGLEVPFISISGTIGEDVAVQVMRLGATDYLLKDRLARLGPAVSQALEQNRLRKERRDLEEQFRQSQKMEVIGRLAGGVAHDFNNILTVIQGYATLLEQGTMEGREAAREIAFAVERAAALSRQLLTFSRKQVMQPQDLDLNAVVLDMTKMLRRTLGKDLTLVVETGPGLPLIHADKAMMEQILLNLAVNARDAMPNGGRLMITTEPHTAYDGASEQSAETNGPAVLLRVSDNGCGISAENLPRIFEPFFTTKEASKGTGLGLATVQGIVRQHHGKIDVRTEPGAGTRFDIILPARPAVPKTAVSKPPEIATAGGHETVLIVEDEPALRNMMRFALRHFGYHVFEAGSGQQALAIFEKDDHKIDLLLTNVLMPDGNGYDLAEQLRARDPDLRVLYTSGYTNDLADRGAPLPAGVHFLEKPYSMQTLGKAIHNCLRDGA